MKGKYKIEGESPPRIYFDREEDLERFLREETGWAEEDIARFIGHERAHFDKAVVLGYQPRYNARLTLDSKRVHGLAVDVPGVTPEHMAQIAMAPEDPGYWDIELADRGEQ